MKLSAYIETLQASLALHGDVEVLHSDPDGDFDEDIPGPTICKRIDGEIVTIYDHELHLRSYERRAENIAAIDAAWDSFTHGMRMSWGSKAALTKQTMDGLNRTAGIVEGWSSAPVLLVL